MAVSQRKFSQDSTASSVQDGTERVVGLQGSPLANVLFTMAQLHTLPSFTVSGAPDPTAFPGRLIAVSNGDSGAPCLAYSNGTNWIVIALGSPIST